MSVVWCAAETARSAAVEQIARERRYPKIGGVLDKDAVMRLQRAAGEAEDCQNTMVKVLADRKLKRLSCSDERIARLLACVEWDECSQQRWLPLAGCDAPEIGFYRMYLGGSPD